MRRSERKRPTFVIFCWCCNCSSLFAPHPVISYKISPYYACLLLMTCTKVPYNRFESIYLVRKDIWLWKSWLPFTMSPCVQRSTTWRHMQDSCPPCHSLLQCCYIFSIFHYNFFWHSVELVWFLKRMRQWPGKICIGQFASRSVGFFCLK